MFVFKIKACRARLDFSIILYLKSRFDRSIGLPNIFLITLLTAHSIILIYCLISIIYTSKVRCIWDAYNYYIIIFLSPMLFAQF